MSPGSIMPRYPWFLTNTLDYSHLAKKISVLRSVGVTYPPGFEAQAETDLKAQAQKISANLQTQGVTVAWDKEIIALIAYLQRLGTDIKVK